MGLIALGWCFSLILLWLPLPGQAYLRGELHYCRKEGAPVQIRKLFRGMYSDCHDCFCKNHLIQCSRKKCPSLDGCFRVERPHPQSCCNTCKGCYMDGLIIPHGSSWADKCQHHECLAGVMTNSKIECHVPCAKAVPAGKDECCDKCPDCWLNNQRLVEGQRMTSRDDPCVSCVCKGGLLSCTKRACPVLSCPRNSAVMDKDGCCLVCTGNRKINLQNGRCFLGKSIYASNATKVHDDCTTCHCLEGYLNCTKSTCPPINCPSKYREWKSGDCCPKCIYPERSQVCLVHGVMRQDGERWQLDSCSDCECQAGKTMCYVRKCENITNMSCPRGYKLGYVNESDCCPSCIEQPGVCVSFGDPHYRTFDDFHFNFQGDCRYELARDCQRGSEKMGAFSVRVNNDARRSNFFSWTRSLSIKLMVKEKLFKISLGQKMRIKVNRRRHRAPYIGSNFNITKNGHSLTLTTDFGLKIVWDGASYVEVEVGVQWRNKTCGLCGNFNRNPHDDLMARGGEIKRTQEEMADSWQSGKTSACSLRHRRLEYEEQMTLLELDHIGASMPNKRSQRLTCVTTTSEARELCGVLNHTSFDQCHKVIKRDKYYSACLLDLCECPTPRNCHCAAIVAYVRECERNGYEIADWKNITSCGGLTCPYGSMYMCAPPCQPTCASGQMVGSCLMEKCTHKCFCPYPLVLHRNTCISQDLCPRNDKLYRRSKRRNRKSKRKTESKQKRKKGTKRKNFLR